MSRLSSKEAVVEEELYHLTRVILDRNNSILNGVAFGKVEPQHSVEGGIADLVLHFADNKHFLVIECKRKITTGTQAIRDFDVFGSNVLNQTLNYAIRLGTLAFATTNGSRLALFRTPKAGEPFRIDTHRLLVLDPFKLDEKNVENLLDFLSKWHSGAPVRFVGIDWFFISRLRSFVDFLSKSFNPVVKNLVTNKEFLRQFEEFSKTVGGITLDQLARETAYLLMNKLVFYKTLERHYAISKLKPISAPDGKFFIKFLRGFFEKAITVTGDFEPIFITNFYDEIPLPDNEIILDEINCFIKELDDYRLEEVGSDIVGYIYEELIPEDERHRLGQFYTPPPIAELIVKWAVRKSTDYVLDPAVGSGTFPVKAYKRLLELMIEQSNKNNKSLSIAETHKKILSQLFADDINPFSAHLTSVNLAMRNVKHPTSEMNIFVEDFFALRSRMEVFSPYVIKTPQGEIKRHISIPAFDAVIANPPYTRGVEIADKTQKLISLSIGSDLKKYKMSGGLFNETGIYIHFIIHSLAFLKPHGRVAMIINNSWLQTDYGIMFGKFLLDHFKIKAVIDFNQRLFRIPLVATCVLLLEREDSPTERENNTAVFLYIDKECTVEDILDAIIHPKKWESLFLSNVVKQKNIIDNDKWIKNFCRLQKIESAINATKLLIPSQDIFESNYGNIGGVSARGGTGADKFFYLSKDQANKWSLPDEYLFPVLVRSRYNKFFSFSTEDWKVIRNNGKPCYAFICHRPLSALSNPIKEYILWGEKTNLVRVKEDEEPKKANQSLASMTREKNKKRFFGWYDLRNVSKSPIITSRRAQYRNRFAKICSDNLAIDDGFITFTPKQELTQLQLEAILATINSDLGRFYIEILGRSTGGGVIELDDKSAGKIPIINCSKIPKVELIKLSELFNALEAKARQIGEAETESSIQKLQSIVDEINAKIASILKIEPSIMKEIQENTKFLFGRRIARINEATPDAVKGEEEPKIIPPKKSKKQPSIDNSRKLTKWFE